MADELEFCTFYVDEHYFGVDVRKVQEVIRYQAMTRVPLARRAVSGLINLRGQIVTAIDIRRRFGLSDRACEHLPVNLIIKTDDGAISLLVDEIGDVLKVPQSLFEPLPETLQGRARQMLLGAYKLNDRLLLTLDTEKVLHLECDE